MLKIPTQAQQRKLSKLTDALKKLEQKLKSPMPADETKRLKEQLAKLTKERADLDKQIPTAMVMQEMPRPRDTFMLVRGQYDKKSVKVTASVPEHLSPLPKDVPLNRLGLARWLV